MPVRRALFDLERGELCDRVVEACAERRGDDRPERRRLRLEEPLDASQRVQDVGEDDLHKTLLWKCVMDATGYT